MAKSKPESTPRTIQAVVAWVARMMKALGSRLGSLEADLVKVREGQATVLAELRARGLGHLPEPETEQQIRLSDEARKARRVARAEHARQFSQGRKKGGRKR